MLADPDIANKAASGECIRECLNCNKGCVDAIQGRRYISCVLNAENGNEGTVFIKPAEKIKNIAVVGAGIAGLEAARVAAKRGHHVTVYEKSDKRLYVDENSAVSYRFPERIEQIFVDGDDLYVLFESAAYAYSSASVNIVDRVLKLSLPRMEEYQQSIQSNVSQY